MNKKKKIKLVITIVLIIVLLIAMSKIIIKNVFKIDYIDLIEKYATEYNVDPLLILSIIKAESNFKQNVVSHQNAIGLMQIMEDTAKELAEKEEMEYTDETLFNPEVNIKLGTKYIAELLEKYNGNYELAVAAYNAGFGNVTKWIESGVLNEDGSNIEKIPFKETNNYVRKIIRNYKIYEKLYEENKQK